ncbi:MAG: UDP-N-acetylglucosamine 2-epimerase [Actinobacteria bacterium]|nr:UDP-N-acetylglucosamine 2-epimerase [Actinomycetota bacterium]
MGTVKKKIYFFMGTTAEFIKLAPIMKELRKRGIGYKIITSGQNKIHFEELNAFLGPVKANIALKEKSTKSSIFLFLGWAIKSLLEGIFSLSKEFKNLNQDNSYFIIHGDTISSLIGSIIAKTHGLKLVHIESGLRSFNFFEPFPEEICRFVIIHIADILFCPSEWALSNLKNVKGVKINTNQNTLIETYQWSQSVKNIPNYAKKYGKYFILVMHRQEHIYFQKRWTQNTIDFVINQSSKDLKCAFIMHTLTKRLMRPKEFKLWLNTKSKVVAVPRLNYVNFMHFMKKAEFIATDGGINQEEAYYMGLPMLSLRNNTERTEGLSNNVVLSKGDQQTIINFLKNYKKYKRRSINLKKRPSKIIVDYLS